MVGRYRTPWLNAPGISRAVSWAPANRCGLRAATTGAASFLKADPIEGHPIQCSRAGRHPMCMAKSNGVRWQLSTFSIVTLNDCFAMRSFGRLVMHAFFVWGRVGMRAHSLQRLRVYCHAAMRRSPLTYGLLSIY